MKKKKQTTKIYRLIDTVDNEYLVSESKRECDLLLAKKRYELESKLPKDKKHLAKGWFKVVTHE